MNSNHTWLNAGAQAEEPDSILQYYKKLIRIIKKNNIVCYGNYEEYMEESDEVYLYRRSTDEGQIFVLCNFTREEQDISEEMIAGDAEILIGNYDEHVKGKLKAYEAVVYCSR